jgi:putative ABC transport system substrate-binding protein
MAVIWGLGLCAGPVAAQTATKPAVVGYLGSSAPSIEPHYVEAFRAELRRLGYVEGRDITIVYRWAEGHDDHLPRLAAELVGINPDVIVTTGTPGAFAAKGATATIPIVMASAGDPVRSGLVASLARPGGNVTGNTVLGPELEGKRLAGLAEFQRTATRDTRDAGARDGGPARRGARPGPRDDRERTGRRAHRAADDGGLMSYAPSNVELFRSSARYVERILKGARPQDLPVAEPSKFELVLNLGTAKTLAVTFPRALLVEADELLR